MATPNGHMTLGGGTTLFFEEGDRLAKPSYHLSGKSVIGGRNAELYRNIQDFYFF